MDFKEYCQFEECQKLIHISFGCTECHGTFCKNHHHQTHHDCLSNYNNKNKKRTCSSMDTITENNTYSDATRCAFESCDKASDSDVFIAFVCGTCSRTYCATHRHIEDHKCEEITPNMKEIAVKSGYWECVTCSFMNVASNKQCMVCLLLLQSSSDTNDIDIDIICPYCSKSAESNAYKTHIQNCEKRYNQKRMNRYRNKNNESVCPYCKKAVNEIIFDMHLKQCGKKMNIDEKEDVNQICPTCLQYVDYKIYVPHTMKCTANKTAQAQEARLDENDTGSFCPVCSELVPNRVYEKHLASCYERKDEETVDEAQKCPYCKRVIVKYFVDHLSVCAANDNSDDDVDMQRNPKKKKHVTFKGISSPNMPTRELISYRHKNHREGLKGTYHRRRTSKPKHLWRQSVMRDVVRITPQKRLRTSHNSAFDIKEPKRKKQRIENEVCSDYKSDDLEIDDIQAKDYKQYVPNKKPLYKNPYFKQTLAHLKDVSRFNGNNAAKEDHVICYWFVPSQHNHKESVYKITQNDYNILESDYKNLTSYLMDFGLKYIYVEWLPSFKERVHVFSCRFYEDEVRDIHSNNLDITYFDFLFDVDFIVIPKMNEYTKCWELIIICYHNCIINKKAARKPCIVRWDVLQKSKRGTNKVNDTVRKWLDLQFKKKYNKSEDDAVLFTTRSIKAYNTVKIPKLMNETYKNESGFYLLLNFRKWGVSAGYQNTTNLSKLQMAHSQMNFGYQQVREHRSNMIQIIKRLQKMKQKELTANNRRTAV